MVFLKFRDQNQKWIKRDLANYRHIKYLVIARQRASYHKVLLEVVWYQIVLQFVIINASRYR